VNRNIILIGGGGHCESVIDIIEQQGEYNIFGIVDIESKVGSKVLGHEIIGTEANLEEIRGKVINAHISLGYVKINKKRKELFQFLKKIGYSFPTIISPKSHVSAHAEILEGTIIHHGAIVNSNSKIGSNCIINSNSLTEHGVIIKSNSHISTGVILNGNVSVGENCFIGSGSIVIEQTVIPDNSFIKAGTLYK